MTRAWRSSGGITSCRRSTGAPRCQIETVATTNVLVPQPRDREPDCQPQRRWRHLVELERRLLHHAGALGQGVSSAPPKADECSTFRRNLPSPTSLLRSPVPSFDFNEIWVLPESHLERGERIQRGSGEGSASRIFSSVRQLPDSLARSIVLIFLLHRPTLWKARAAVYRSRGQVGVAPHPPRGAGRLFGGVDRREPSLDCIQQLRRLTSSRRPPRLDFGVTARPRSSRRSCWCTTRSRSIARHCEPCIP